MIYLYIVAGLAILYWKHKGGLTALPDHLKFKIHNDYTFPLCLLPRTLTSYRAVRPPKLLIGYNLTDFATLNGRIAPYPIQRKLNGKFCSFQICYPLYFSISFKWGWYIMAGWRYDTVDSYYTFPAADISKIERFDP